MFISCLITAVTVSLNSFYFDYFLNQICNNKKYQTFVIFDFSVTYTVRFNSQSSKDTARKQSFKKEALLTLD